MVIELNWNFGWTDDSYQKIPVSRRYELNLNETRRPFSSEIMI
jgi:hypothetical protein